MTSSLTTSSIGRKFLMAVSGLLLFGFLIAHLLGNLLIFQGKEALNDYAQTLHSMSGVLWVARIGLLIFFLVHIKTAFNLWIKNRQAKPSKYIAESTARASVASRFMLESGIVVLLFIILHLSHFTFKILQPGFATTIGIDGREDVYSMVVNGFQNELYAIIYIICLSLIGIHLSHGITSLFQTVGVSLTSARNYNQIEKILKGFVLIITLGYISIPLSVLIGFIHL